jgi:hypothetical protein
MVIISLPQAGDNNQFITYLVFTYAPECAMLYSQRCPGCHPERSEGSLPPASQTLRGVYTERSECAQGDRPYLQMSSVSKR